MVIIRKPSKQCRVRGIGQQAGTGQTMKYDLWLSMKVRGREVLLGDHTHGTREWGGTEHACGRVVCSTGRDERTDPRGRGRDEDLDVIHRAANQLVVIEYKERPLERGLCTCTPWEH